MTHPQLFPLLRAMWAEGPMPRTLPPAIRSVMAACTLLMVPMLLMFDIVAWPFRIVGAGVLALTEGPHPGA